MRPEQKITRVAFCTVSSGINFWNCPVVKSCNFDAAARKRNIDLGVKTTIGLRVGFFACHLSKWKYEAGFDG